MMKSYMERIFSATIILLLVLPALIMSVSAAESTDLDDAMDVGDDASDLFDLMWKAFIAVLGIIILYVLSMNFFDHLKEFPSSVSGIGPWFWSYVTSNFKLLIAFVIIIIIFMMFMNEIFGLSLSF